MPRDSGGTGTQSPLLSGHWFRGNLLIDYFLSALSVFGKSSADCTHQINELKMSRVLKFFKKIFLLGTFMHLFIHNFSSCSVYLK